MMRIRRSRGAWGLCAVLAGSILGGSVLLLVRLRPYWVAKYRGESACLRGAELSGAPLSGANLSDADLRHSNLRYANLSSAYLTGADLTGARLIHANLRGASLWFTRLRGVDL